MATFVEFIVFATRYMNLGRIDEIIDDSKCPAQFVQNQRIYAITMDNNGCPICETCNVFEINDESCPETCPATANSSEKACN